MVDSPTVNEITAERIQEIGNQIRELERGDEIRVTNSRMDAYITGTVTASQTEREGHYTAFVEAEDGTRYELHVNWSDIPADAEDQETPYTGLLREALRDGQPLDGADAPPVFDDTAPPVTDIEVL